MFGVTDVGRYTNVQPDSKSARVDEESDENNTFPALRRTHIMLGTMSRPISHALLRPLDVAANTLAHVRFSNVDGAAMSMGLIGALSTSDVYLDIFGQPPPGTSLFPSLVLPTLHHVAIQYTLRGEHEAEAGVLQPPTTAVQVYNFEAHEGKISHMAHMYLFSDREHVDRHWRSREKGEWLDRIEGACGCWTQSIH
ncbi:hypothetical protein C8Q73DRAFT_663217 [Cubamyces lactineus]|nr:hypothetical protein C8Q73DRAFT_663217 [Cubamyces lactineus]